MASERVAGHERLVLEVDVESRWPITLAGRHVELELSENEAEWLITTGLPTALDRARKGAA